MKKVKFAPVVFPIFPEKFSSFFQEKKIEKNLVEKMKKK